MEHAKGEARAGRMVGVQTEANASCDQRRSLSANRSVQISSSGDLQCPRHDQSQKEEAPPMRGTGRDFFNSLGIE